MGVSNIKSLPHGKRTLSLFNGDVRMRILMAGVLFFLLMVGMGVQAQEVGPADALWEIYKQGDFEGVVLQGKAMLITDNETAQVNLAVGRSLVHLDKFDEAFPYLKRAAELDPQKNWVYAWAQVYLGISHFKTGQEKRAGQAWILARDCNATRNATRSAENNLNYLGLSEFFEQWKSFESEHFKFRFSGRLQDFNRVDFARSHDQAYGIITKWFGGGPDQKIRFLLWSSQEEADEAGMPTMGFSRPEEYLTHAVLGQTVGHEMTHIISRHAMKPTVISGLINEGVAVHMDLTGRDQMQRAINLMAEAKVKPLKVSIPALWLDWSLLPDLYSYPVAGAFVGMLVENGGKEKFLEFFVDQSFGHAQEVYGSDLQTWIDDFEKELYQ